MDFNTIVKMGELEFKSKGKSEHRYIEMMLSKLVQYVDKEYQKSKKTIDKMDLIQGIEETLKSFLIQTSESNLKSNIIHYYIKNKLYDNEYNLRSIFDKVSNEMSEGKIDKEQLETMTYTFNIRKSLEQEVIIALNSVRETKKNICDIGNMEFVFRQLQNVKSTKEREIFIKNMYKSVIKDNPDLQELYTEQNCLEDYRKMHKMFKKSEYELVQEEIAKLQNDSAKKLKEECIKSIVESVNILDKFGLLEDYVNANNKLYKNVYINDINYKYEEVKEILSEENLKKLNTDALIMMSSFWINRVNKIIKDLNNVMYIFKRSELIEEIEQDDGEVVYGIKGENIANVTIKTNVLHKIYFQLFEELDMIRDCDIDEDVEKGNTIDGKKHLEKITKKYGKEYKEYFDKLFPNSKNSLMEDLQDVMLFENARFNSYKIKDVNILSLLTCLFNSSSDLIKNFGYVEEPSRKNRKEILISADLKGFNMPFAVHINKDVLIEYLKETQGNTLIPVYKGAEDFDLGDRILKAQIFVPLSKQAEKAINENAERVNLSKDRYGKTVLHLNYFTSKGKMPNHMMKANKSKKGVKYKYVREYYDLEKNEYVDVDKSKSR